MASRGADSTFVEVFRGPKGSVASDICAFQYHGPRATLGEQHLLEFGFGYALVYGSPEVLRGVHGVI